jgi:UDP-3-O-[3-hydroxymyristoyl] glucosamine N-acyltransferase
MTVKSRIRLGDLFSALDLIGDYSALQSLPLHRIAPAEVAAEGDLVFVGQDRLLPLLSKSAPSAIVVSDSLWDAASALSLKAPLLRSKDAMLAFAKASVFFSTELCFEAGVHPLAVVHPSARLGARVLVGAGSVVGEGAEIGDGAVLHPRVSVGARSKVGKDSVLFPGVVLYQDVSLGERVRVHANSVIGADGFGYVQEKTSRGVKHVKIHHLGGVRIGNDVEIGASTTIDRGTLGDTIIENGCIIDNQVQIGHNCHLEEGVIICGCVGMAGSAHVEKFALIAGFTAVANKVRIGAGAQVAGFTPVTGHVPAGAKWGGIPAMQRSDYARLQVLFKRLPELFGKKERKA